MQDFTNHTDFIGVDFNEPTSVSGFLVLKTNPGGTKLIDSQFLGPAQAFSAAFDSVGHSAIAGSSTGTAAAHSGGAQPQVTAAQDALDRRD